MLGKRTRTWWLFALGALLPISAAAGCDGALAPGGPLSPGAGSPPPARSAGSAAAAVASATTRPATAAGAGLGPPAPRPPAPTAQRHPLSAATPQPLALTLLPVHGKRWALLTGQLGERHVVKRLLADGPEAGVRELGQRRPVMGLDGKHPWLLSSDGSQLCVERLDQPTLPNCRPLRATAAALLGDTIVLLEERPDDAVSAAPTPAAVAAPRRKGLTPSLHQATDPALVKMRVWLHRLDADGAFAAPPIDSKLRFVRPLPGMGLLDAAPAGKRLWVLYYEHKDPRQDGKRRIPQARLRVAELDAHGHFIRRSKRTLFAGDRQYGYIEGHHRPRLFGHRGGAAMVGRFAKLDGGRMLVGFEAIGLRPWGVRLAPNALMALDPWRLAGGPPLDKQARTALDQLAARQPVRAPGQPTSDSGRVVWVGERGYYLCDDALCSSQLPDGSSSRIERPFGAQTSQIAWAGVDAAGWGLAATDDGLQELAADGSLRRHPAPATASWASPGRAAVRIGDGWWRLLPSANVPSAQRVVRLLPAELEAKDLAAVAYPDRSRLLGGAAHGRLLSLAAGELTSFKLHPDGRSERLGSVATPLALAFEAAARPDGGAWLAGTDLAGRWISFVVSPDGSRGALWELPVDLPSDAVVRLVALPQGGALLLERTRQLAVWLADDGRPTSALSLADGPPGPACNGWPLADRPPAEKPGSAFAAAQLANVADCAAHPPQLQADGSLRWFGRQLDGLSDQAVAVVSLPLIASAAQQARQLAPKRLEPPAAVRASKASRRRCPLDMVLVARSYCVDRFEAQLLDSTSALPLSPHYPSEAGIVSTVLRAWAGGRFDEGDLHAQARELPPLLRPAAQTVTPRAQSGFGVVPSGFVSGYAAERACKTAGKRLCSAAEWKRACRGEADRTFPYGDSYEQDSCNVHGWVHPANELHGNAAVGHLDPRLNTLSVDGQPLLHRTGTTRQCASRWGDDAIYDMVGNLDEWLDDKQGSFAGGFYARSTKLGCAAKISAHPRRYLDYSLGVRCCLDAR